MPTSRPARFGLSAAPRPAVALGFAGLIPFVGLALLAHMAPIDVALRAQYSLSVYGAVILGFMGGCRWGFAASGMGEGTRLVSEAPETMKLARRALNEVMSQADQIKRSDEEELQLAQRVVALLVKHGLTQKKSSNNTRASSDSENHTRPEQCSTTSLDTAHQNKKKKWLPLYMDPPPSI